MTDTNKERAEFEAWYASQPDATAEPERSYELDEAGMNDLIKDCIWEGWQARAAKAPAAPTQAEPMFWVRLLRDGMYEGPVHHKSVGGKMMRDEKPDEWHPLYTAPPAPTEQWMPIEDIPAQGSFQVYMPDEPECHRIQTMVRHQNVTSIGNHFDFDMSKPTHYRNLPAPPQGAAK